MSEVIQKSYYDNLQAENERITKMLLNILAVIHCDGGHTTAGMGIERSFNRAIDVRNQQIIKMDALQAENERLRAALEYIGGKCHNYTSGDCYSSGTNRRLDTPYTDERVCDACIANAALGYGVNHEE